MIAGHVVPSEIRAALTRYVEHHIETGGFLRAVLENDLFAAVTRADHLNFERLPDIISYIHETLPVGSYGTPERVREWLSERDFTAEQRHRSEGPDTTLLGPDA